MIVSTSDKCLREAVARRGLVLQKRRARLIDKGIKAGYAIYDPNTGTTLAGKRFELTPEDVRDWLNEH